MSCDNRKINSLIVGYLEKARSDDMIYSNPFTIQISLIRVIGFFSEIRQVVERIFDKHVIHCNESF
jgi:hypothetical protein